MAITGGYALLILFSILIAFATLTPPALAAAYARDASNRHTKTATSVGLLGGDLTNKSAGNAENAKENSGNLSYNENDGAIIIESEETSDGIHGISPAKWSFDYVKPHLVLTLFMLSVAISKIVYYNTDILSSWMPESCILILLGASMGYMILATTCSVQHISSGASVNNSSCSHSFSISMTPAFFFLVLVPPIVLESAYNLHDRTFIENLGGVMCFAVVGTVANFLLIGLMLFASGLIGAFSQPQLNLRQALLFSSFIVAVDPIAVLSIFEEIGVDRNLYFLVFGESLLNDAVTVVLYNVMSAFSRIPKVDVVQIALAIVSFFTVSMGGMVIGVIIGALSSVLLKYTRNVRVVEPLLVFVTAYLSYLLAELFDWSGIISIIFCGLTQAQYAFHNISHKSYTTVKYFSKTLASVSEAMIFLLLGMELVNNYKHDWNLAFIASAIIVCLIVRFIVVMAVSLLTNYCWNTLRKISLTDQFIIAYGGLRGAVAFSLAASLELSSNDAVQKHAFITTTLSIIIFTVFFQGTTIKPLVKLLRIRVEARKQLSLVCEITSHLQDHICAGIEEIIGTRGSFYIKEYLSYADGKYLKPLLQREPQTRDQKIMQIYQKIALRMHFATINTTSKNQSYDDRLSPGLMRSISNRSIPALVEPQPIEPSPSPSPPHPDPDPESINLMENLNQNGKGNDSFAPERPEDSSSDELPESHNEVAKRPVVSPDKVMRVMRMHSLQRNRRSYKHHSVDGPHTNYLRELEEKSIVVSKLARMRQNAVSVSDERGGCSSNLAPLNRRARTAADRGQLQPPAVSIKREDSIMSLLFCNQEDILLDVTQACIAASVLCAPVLSTGGVATEQDHGARSSAAKKKFSRTSGGGKRSRATDETELDGEEETSSLCDVVMTDVVAPEKKSGSSRNAVRLGSIPTITIDKPDSERGKRATEPHNTAV